MLDTFYDRPQKNSQKLSRKKIFVLRLIFDSRLHEAPHIGSMGESNHKRWNSQLAVVPSVLCLDLLADFASPNRANFVGGLS